MSHQHLKGIVTLIGLVASTLLTTGCQTEKPAVAAPTLDRKPRPVKVTAATQEPLPRGIEVTGTLAAHDQVQLAMKVPGRVAEMLVDLGDRVKKGQPLARIDPTDLDLAVGQAFAALQQARARLGLPLDSANEQISVPETPIVREAAAMLNEAKANRKRAQQMFE